MTTVRVPVRVRLELAEDRVGDPGLAALVGSAVAAAAGRAMDRARGVQAVGRAASGDVPCRLSVRFAGGPLPGQVAAELEASIRAALWEAAAGLRARPGVSRGLVPAAAGSGEERDEDRVVPDPRHRVGDAYLVPSYDQRGQPVAVPLRDQRPAVPKRQLAASRRRGKTVLTTAPGQERAFFDLLRRTALDERLPEQQRRDAIDTLVDMRDWPEAVAILREGLTIPGQWNAIRWQFRSALRRVAGSHDEIWALMLLTVDSPQEQVTENYFADRFRQGGGTYMVGFLERQLHGDDAMLREKAAHVTLFLLDLQYASDAGRLASNLARLRAMAARNQLWTRGALGIASLRQLIKSQLNLLEDLTAIVAEECGRAPYGDPNAGTDRAALERLAAALDDRRQDIDTAALTELEWLDIRLAQGVQAALTIRQRLENLHDNIRTLRGYLDATSEDTDEVTALFALGHGYVATFANLFAEPDFVTAMYRADFAYAHFGDAVAAVKWPHIQRRFGEAVQVLTQANEIQPGAGPVEDDVFFSLRKSLATAEDWLRSQLAGEIKGTLGGRTVRVTGLAPPELARVVELEMAVNVFALYAGMFALYALALRVHNDLVRIEVGNASFRQEQGAKLTRIRGEIAGYAGKRQFDQFSKRADALRQEIEDVTRAIQRRARLDIGISLLITAVATLLTLGAAAIVRIALLGETLALLRTADAASTIVLLVEAGTFTTAQLAGERLALDRPVELGKAAETFAQNVLTFGLFRLVGETVRPLARGRALLEFVLPHTTNLAIMTGISALVTRARTGAWPPDIESFLLENLASYVILAGVSAAGGAALRQVTAPAIQTRIRGMTTQLDAELAGLYGRYRRAVEGGTLSEPEFEAIRQERLRLNQRARELGNFLHNERLITDEQAAALSERLDADARFVHAARFTAPPRRLTAGPRMVQALRLPTDIPGLTRLGATEIYRYDPIRPPNEIEPMLEAHEAQGFRVRRYPGGVVHVTDLSGRTRFVLEPGPPVPALLPPPSVLPSRPRPPGADPLELLRRVVGELPESELMAIAARLRQIEPGLLPTLQREFPEQTSMAALALLVEARNALTARWSRNAVRGLAHMLELERGITLATVRRLFRELTPTQLGTLFGRFQEIRDMPGANLIVTDELPGEASADLAEAYDALRRARLQLPQAMSRQAARGLRRWLNEHRDVVAELRATRPESRLAVLEAASPRVDPTRLPVSRVEAALRRHAQDIRPGLNLLHDTPAAAARAVEALAHTHGGRFSSDSVRAELEWSIRYYRDEVARLQAGTTVDTRNLEGRRAEIEAVIVTLESGVIVDTVGNLVDFTVDPARVPLPGGFTIVNAPPDVRVQLDVGAHRASGQLLLIEATTARLGLPALMAGLDPQSGSHGGTIDWARFNPDAASDRKWMQIIKMWQLAAFLRDLDAAFRGSDIGAIAVEPPELVLRVSGATEAASRVAARFGVRLEIVAEP